MNKFFRRSFSKILSPVVVLLAPVLLLAPCAAQATPYIVKLVQQGPNVVATGSGEFDLNGLTFNTESPYSIGKEIQSLNGYLATGPTGPVSFGDGYSGASGPTNFGSGGGTRYTTGSGDAVAIYGSSSGSPLVLVPQGYQTGTDLTSGATWDNANFASLGVTPGTYTWKWGTGAADQSFTLMIGTTAVPEPAALGMFGLGVLLIGGFVTLRRREQRQAC